MNSRPCRFFLIGTCRNGTDCRFYHEGFSNIPRSVLTGDSDLSISTSSTRQQNDTTTGRRANNRPNSSGTSAASTSSSPSYSSPSSSSTTQTPTSTSSSRPWYASSQPCKWYMAGYCIRGDSCWFSHARFMTQERPHSVVSSDNRAENDHGNGDRSSTAGAGVRTNMDENEDQKCAICFEVPTTFGLLVSCNHAFCLTCIRTWRANNIEQDQRSDQERTSVTKACPNCRTPSLFVVPSSFFPITSDQKEIIIQNYKTAAANKPCKYFVESGDLRWCPFGDDCFFAHRDAQGRPCKVIPRPNRQQRRRNRYHRYRYSRGLGLNYDDTDDNYGIRTFLTDERTRRMFIENLISGRPQNSNQLENLQELLEQFTRVRVEDESSSPVHSFVEHTGEYLTTTAFLDYDGYDDNDDDEDYDDINGNVNEDEVEEQDDYSEDDGNVTDSDSSFELNEQETYELNNDYLRTRHSGYSGSRTRRPTVSAEWDWAYDTNCYHEDI